MIYTTQQAVQDEIGGQNRLIEALDDASAGVLDMGLLTRLMQAASSAVDGFLQGRYIIPLSPVPSLASEAALVFTLEKIFNRRKQGVDEKNPYEARASEMRKRLKAVSDRKESIDAQEWPAFVPGAVIHHPSSLDGSSL